MRPRGPAYGAAAALGRVSSVSAWLSHAGWMWPDPLQRGLTRREDISAFLPRLQRHAASFLLSLGLLGALPFIAPSAGFVLSVKTGSTAGDEDGEGGSREVYWTHRPHYLSIYLSLWPQRLRVQQCASGNAMWQARPRCSWRVRFKARWLELWRGWSLRRLGVVVGPDSMHCNRRNWHSYWCPPKIWKIMQSITFVTPGIIQDKVASADEKLSLWTIMWNKNYKCNYSLFIIHKCNMITV